MKITATIQARTGSSRLSTKVLRPILGEPMLARQLERVRRSMLIDEIVVATSTNPNDDAIERMTERVGVGCFRGSEERVFDRILGALDSFNVDVHVEMYGDCPLPEPALVDQIIGTYLKVRDAYDLVCTGMKTTFPPGLEVTVYHASVLRDLDRTAGADLDRGMVSPNIRMRRDRYRVLNIEAPSWYRYPDIHLEVDTAEDFEVVRTLYERLYPANPAFGLNEIMAFLKDHPELAEANRHVERRWKAFRQE